MPVAKIFNATNDFFRDQIKYYLKFNLKEFKSISHQNVE